MNRLTVLADEAWQQVYPVLDDGTVLTLEVIYLASIQRWMFNLTHPNLTLNASLLCVHPNLLHSWRNIINFGIACLSTDGVDPVDIEDFSTGRVQLYILNATDLAAVDSEVFAA